MNKRGQLIQLFILMIIAIVGLLFLAGFWYGFDLLTDKILTIETSGTGANITDAAERTFQQVNNALPMLRFVSFALIIGMMMSIFISNYFRKVHPAFFAVYIFMVIAAVVVSVPIANTHDTLIQEQQIGGKLAEFSATNIIIGNLPIWIAIIGTIGAIFLFSGIIIDKGQGGGFEQ